MVKTNISKETLLNYIRLHEVVYQVIDNLINLSNDTEKDNKNQLLSYLIKTNKVEFYKKNNSYIKENFADLNNWSTEDDALFLLDDVSVLICIPKKYALDYHLIEK